MFGGSWEGVRLSIIGTVEPSWEKVTEPLEPYTEGDNGAGLEFLLGCCETEMDERRFIHEALLDDAWVPVSDSFAPCSPEGVKPLTTLWGGRIFASPLVILLIIGRRWGRPS